MARGGKRDGAGRPSEGRVMVSVRLPIWLVEWLRSQDASQAALIEDALVRQHRLQRK